MLAIVVSRAEEPRWRKTFATSEVTVGSHPDNQLVLDEDSADLRHARLVVREGKVIIVDLKSTGGTFVNGHRMTSPLVVRSADDQLAIGAYTLNAFLAAPEPLVQFRSRGPTERDLLSAIAEGDEASRPVYADWLEQQGDLARAELLRLQLALEAMTPDAPGFERTSDRLREVAAGVDLGWRSRVARRPIEGCPAFDYVCPKQWSALAPTEHAGVRHCGACDQPVHYCASVEDARAHAARGACVALDVTSARWADDLAAPFGVHRCDRCHVDVGAGLERCPRCGDATASRATIRGLMLG